MIVSISRPAGRAWLTQSVSKWAGRQVLKVKQQLADCYSMLIVIVSTASLYDRKVYLLPRLAIAAAICSCIVMAALGLGRPPPPPPPPPPAALGVVFLSFMPP